jgi:hypothetical protein
VIFGRWVPRTHAQEAVGGRCSSLILRHDSFAFLAKIFPELAEGAGVGDAKHAGRSGSLQPASPFNWARRSTSKSFHPAHDSAIGLTARQLNQNSLRAGKPSGSLLYGLLFDHPFLIILSYRVRLRPHVCGSRHSLSLKQFAKEKKSCQQRRIVFYLPPNP